MLARLKMLVDTRAVASMIVAPLVFWVVASLAVASYLGFGQLMEPVWAALVTALLGILLVVVTLLITRARTRRKGPFSRSKEPRSPGHPPDHQLEALLQAQADPMLRAWVKANPHKALITAALVGAAAGYNESVQKTLLDMYYRYLAAEDPPPEDD
ncbi:MAG: hypothetical protein ACNA8J_08050 [Gammaproteobacteria bacterium]